MFSRCLDADILVNYFIFFHSNNSLFNFGCAGSSLLYETLDVVSGGYFLVIVCGLLISVVSLVAKHGL